MKKCPGCADTLELSAFSKNAARHDGLNFWCRKCVSMRVKNWPSSQVKRDRHREHIRKYGLTVEVYAQMLEEQGGGCACCGGRCATGKRLAVDHDHATGKVRGLLCARCNTTLGAFKEDRSALANLIHYIGVHS